MSSLDAPAYNLSIHFWVRDRPQLIASIFPFKEKAGSSTWLGRLRGKGDSEEKIIREMYWETSASWCRWPCSCRWAVDCRAQAGELEARSRLGGDHIINRKMQCVKWLSLFVLSVPVRFIVLHQLPQKTRIACREHVLWHWSAWLSIRAMSPVRHLWPHHPASWSFRFHISQMRMIRVSISSSWCFNIFVFSESD